MMVKRKQAQWLEKSLENQYRIIRLLEEQKKQNEEMSSKLSEVVKFIQTNQGTIPTYLLGFDLKISELITLVFKWFVASLPLGIILSIVYWIISMMVK